MKATARHRAERLLLVSVRTIAEKIPLSVLRPALEGAASLAFRVGIRRRVVVENLRAALGADATGAKARRIAKKCYREFGRIVAEFVRSEELLRDPEAAFRVQGLDTLAGAAARGQGVVILTAHLGNFIAGSYLVCRMGHSLTLVARHMSNPLVDADIEAIYAKYGTRVIAVRGSKNDPGGGLRIFRALRKGETVVLLNDQDAGEDSYRSTFLGLPTFIPAGPARYAVRAGATVLTAFVTRVDGRIDVQFQDPIDYSGASGPEEAKALILDEYSRRLEAKVREAPASYFWFHKKWKGVPEIRARYEGRVP
ncbi:MAG: lysophospholipid acyltransferase family protein [Deltaproteobacteria bacterium]